MHICRTRFCKEIITEFVPPKKKDSHKVMIFCAGVPGSPDKDEVLDFWAKRGYWTFFPRYRGTWESGGHFLAASPVKDVFDVIAALKNSFIDCWSGDRFKVKVRSIVIVGSSFGGPAAILSTLDSRINKAICISPVVDWQAENKAEPLDHLYSLMRQGYGHAYRVRKRDWNKLVRGKFYNPVRHVDELDGSKIMIFHAQDDDVVKIGPVARFAKKTGSRLEVLKKGGHLSSCMLTEKRYYRKMSQFIRV